MPTTTHPARPVDGADYAATSVVRLVREYRRLQARVDRGSDCPHLLARWRCRRAAVARIGDRLAAELTRAAARWN